MVALSAVMVAGSAQAAAAVPDEVATEAEAVVAARAGGKSVLVLDRTDESTDVRANPDGTFTWKQHVRPVRVRRDGKFVAVDTTLERRADGSVAPRATVIDLALSGGGKGLPLVRMAAKGAEAGLVWPDELPIPVLDGPTATYPEVLPGVDLKVTADVLGYQQLLVVKTPEAARDPKLREVTFGKHAKGKAEGLSVADERGGPVLTGDASLMWDSSGTPIPGAGGPNEGARRAVMGSAVTDRVVTVKPDQAFLTAPQTTFPVFIDPSHRCNSCGKAHHVVVQSAWPDNKNFDRTDGALSDLKAGYVCEGDCLISRTYLRMHTGSLAGKHIISASMHVETIHSYHCS
ncbi:LamG domain-containing protein, partial [Actinokineospora sp. HBU206404]|nr:LamG domain-containing protein [Actinokineospora xionganensis]